MSPAFAQSTDVTALVASAAHQTPERRALIGGDRALTYGMLEDQVARFATGLGQHGVLAGSRVLICAGNSIEFVVAHLGTLRAQAVSVPVNPRSSEDELVWMMLDSGSRMVVVDSGPADVVRAAVARVEAFLAGEPDARDADLPVAAGAQQARGVAPQLVVIDESPLLGAEVGFEDLLAHEPVSVPPLRDPEKLAELLYTTGTSEWPRAAMLTHRALLANIEQVAQVSPPMVDPDDVVLGVLPLFHVYALNAVLGAVLRQRAALVLIDHVDPDGLLRVIDAQRCTVVPVAPPVFTRWLADPELEQRMAHVRLVLSGSAPLAASVIRDFAARTGVAVHQGYGLTEAAPVVTSTLCSVEVEPGSEGAVLPGVELEIVDEQHGHPDDEEPGEIRIRGANLFSGYWPDGADGPDADGWWRTGDLGVRNGEDNLFLLDPVRDLITVSGFNVYPVEIEEIIARVEGVREVAVVGAADERAGQVVVAYLVPVDATEPQEALVARVVDHVAGRLARFKQPSRIEVVAELPRTTSGQVQKGHLRGIERRRSLGLLE